MDKIIRRKQSRTRPWKRRPHFRLDGRFKIAGRTWLVGLMDVSFGDLHELVITHCPNGCGRELEGKSGDTSLTCWDCWASRVRRIRTIRDATVRSSLIRSGVARIVVPRAVRDATDRVRRTCGNEHALRRQAISREHVHWWGGESTAGIRGC
ncbi:hypothetical protein HY634_03040 [Candidatus Uhrbacteria bacterium]|nr:hypothetical protein [Candidatus Uhrbacteria bacterium]